MIKEQMPNADSSGHTCGNTIVSGSQFKPMLFSTPMVEAIDAGRKTQTRRLVKFPKGWIPEDNAWDWAALSEYYPKWGSKYKIGDIIWVREKWRHNESQTGFPYHHYADDTIYTDRDNEKWKPSLFMPKQACRLFLEVTDIRVQRLQDISEQDSIAEGIDTCFKKGSQYYKPNDYKNYTWHGEGGNDSFSGYSDTKNAKESFQSLWYKIKGAASWEANPFVWVITFQQVECPKGFC